MHFEKYTTVETRVAVRLAFAILQQLPKIVETSENGWNGGEWNKYFSGKFRESPITVEFLKCEPFNRKFWKIREKRKLLERNFRKFEYTTRGCLLYGNFWKMPFHSLPEGLVEWKALKSFLGLASYYQRFIPNYAQVAWPLHKQTEAHVDFASTSECQLSFDKMKTLMSTAQILQQSLCSTKTTTDDHGMELS